MSFISTTFKKDPPVIPTGFTPPPYPHTQLIISNVISPNTYTQLTPSNVIPPEVHTQLLSNNILYPDTHTQLIV